MSFTMEDNLEESGWVAVRPNAFEEKEKHKFVFIVAWNEVEGKCAITCHNRTVQRRSLVGRDSSVLSMEDEESTKTKWPKTSPVREKATALLGSPGRNNQGAMVKAIKSPSSSSTIKTTSSSSPPVADKSPPATSGSSPSPAVSPAEDMEVLEPLKEEDDEDDSQLSVETLDLEEVEVMDTTGLGGGRHHAGEDCSWAGLFSFQDLRAVHLQLCQVNSDLEPCLPAFPEEPGGGSSGGSGVWSALFGSTEVPESEMDELCYRLQLYLGHALDICGWKILSQVLFTESDDPDEYYESLSELRQSGYEEALGRAKKRLQELLEKHRSMESMVDLLQVYEEEDSAYSDLLEASTQLYQFLLQPFRDMRELAMLCRQQIKISMDNDYLGPRRIEALKKEDSDWQKKAQEAVLNIQEFTVQYFEITAKAQKAVYERMRVDQRRLGRSAWSAAVQRMERLRYAVAKETLQLQRARELCLEQRKHALREQMQSLCSGEGAMARLDHLEAQYYELQLRLYDIQAEILQCEELLLTAQLDSIRRQMTELQDEVVYYDTYESPESIREEDAAAEREELGRLQQSARHLEARRGRITTKRSYLKNKREICVSNNAEKQLERHISQKDSTSQHAAQQQRGEEEEDEEQKNCRVSEERQRTLDRLRTFKQRNPGQVILKSARLRVSPHTRRRERERERRWRRSGGGGEEGLESGGRDKASPAAPPPAVCHQSAGVQTEPCVPLLPPPSTTTLCTTQPRVGLSLSPPLQDVSAPAATTHHHQAESSCSPCSLPSLLGSAPPPPPPLPPPSPPPPQGQPTADDTVLSSYSPGEEGSRAAVEQDPPPSSSLSPLGPFVPRFFDSSQLVSARKKLRKVPELDVSRRVSSPMDEVLASLKRGSFHLRKVEQRPLPRGGGGKGGGSEDDEDGDPGSILAQIRRGVKLRRVPQRERRGPPPGVPSCTDPLTRSIHEALRRIKEASPDSDSDDDASNGCHDWES